jgi:hypothetical protein
MDKRKTRTKPPSYIMAEKQELSQIYLRTEDTGIAFRTNNTI